MRKAHPKFDPKNKIRKQINAYNRKLKRQDAKDKRAVRIADRKLRRRLELS